MGEVACFCENGDGFLEFNKREGERSFLTTWGNIFSKRLDSMTLVRDLTTTEDSVCVKYVALRSTATIRNVTMFLIDGLRNAFRTGTVGVLMICCRRKYFIHSSTSSFDMVMKPTAKNIIPLMPC